MTTRCVDEWYGRTQHKTMPSIVLLFAGPSSMVCLRDRNKFWSASDWTQSHWQTLIIIKIIMPFRVQCQYRLILTATLEIPWFRPKYCLNLPITRRPYQLLLSFAACSSSEWVEYSKKQVVLVIACHWYHVYIYYGRTSILRQVLSTYLHRSRGVKWRSASRVNQREFAMKAHQSSRCKSQQQQLATNFLIP